MLKVIIFVNQFGLYSRKGKNEIHYANLQHEQYRRSFYFKKKTSKHLLNLYINDFRIQYVCLHARVAIPNPVTSLASVRSQGSKTNKDRLFSGSNITH